MMEWLRAWIIGVTCASILFAAAQCLMPEGSVRKIGNLAGGLILILAIASPLMKLDEGMLSLALAELRIIESEHESLLELENERLIKEIIEQKTAAYISDKAEELGATCAVEVTYHYSEDGMAYPTAVTIVGDLTVNQQTELTRYIEANLAVSKENQSYEGVINQ